MEQHNVMWCSICGKYPYEKMKCNNQVYFEDLFDTVILNEE